MRLAQFLDKQDKPCIKMNYEQFHGIVKHIINVADDMQDMDVDMEREGWTQLMKYHMQLQIAVFSEFKQRLHRKLIDTKPSKQEITIKMSDKEALAFLIVFRGRPQRELLENKQLEAMLDEIYTQIDQMYA